MPNVGKSETAFDCTDLFDGIFQQNQKSKCRARSCNHTFVVNSFSPGMTGWVLRIGGTRCRLSTPDEAHNSSEQLTGVKGELNEKEGVFKVSVPRTDLQITTAGVKMNPGMGLTSYAAFMKAGAKTMVMGDTALLEDQVNSVMTVALDSGLEVTALHNHFFWDSPKVMFMHIGGMGEEGKLASAVGKVFAKIKEGSGGNGQIPKVDLDPAKTSLDPKNIEGVMGVKGQMANGVYKITIGRTTKMGGHEVGNAMGINTWAAFVGSDQQAVVDGDFVMLEKELQAVLKTLRGAGINVVAIHNHIETESPRVSFCITGELDRRRIWPRV